MNGSGATLYGNIKQQEERQSSKRSQQQDEAWSTTRIIRACTLTTVVLMLLYEGCHPQPDPLGLLGEHGSLVWDWTTFLAVFTFTALQAVLYHLPLGPVEQGRQSTNGRLLTYNCNSFHAFIISSTLLVLLWTTGVFSASRLLTDQIFSLILASYTVSFLMASLLYLIMLRKYPSYRRSSTVGIMVRDFGLGKEISPRVLGIDMKQFFMVRIGFLGWGMTILCYLLAEIERDGAASTPMLLVVTFQLLYLLDFFIDEASVLPTKEFTQEGIGFVMVQGEYIFVPFYTSAPAFYIFHRPQHISLPIAFVICLIYGAGLVIYYLSNDQKDRFRKDPNNPSVANLRTILSPTGQHLLVSGWFGWIRHPNYLGDILMNWAWTIPCGCSSVAPYIPALLCTVILLQRASENEETCHRKHGKAWEEYCKHVPYKLFPFIY